MSKKLRMPTSNQHCMGRFTQRNKTRKKNWGRRTIKEDKNFSFSDTSVNIESPKESISRYKN